MQRARYTLYEYPDASPSALNCYLNTASYHPCTFE